MDHSAGHFWNRRSMGWQPISGLLWWLRYIHKVGAIATPVYRQSVIDHYLTGASVRGLARIELRRPPSPRAISPR